MPLMGIWFAGNAGEGHEPWKTDGTVAGTRQVADVFPGAMSPEPDHFTNVNTLVYFTAIDGVHGRELWKSNGTASGTMLVKDIHPMPSLGGNT